MFLFVISMKLKSAKEREDDRMYENLIKNLGPNGKKIVELTKKIVLHRIEKDGVFKKKIWML